MKWRSLLLVSFAITALFFSSFSTQQTAFAQTSNSYDSYYGATIPLFDNSISATTNVCNLQSSSAQYKTACDVLLPLLNATKSQYISEFNSGKSSNTSPSNTQTAALSKASSYFGSNKGSALVFTNAPSVNVQLDIFSKNLSAAITQSISTTVNGTDTSGATPNASAPTKAADDAAKMAAEKCSFSFVKGFSFIDCADVFVTWIIKNTFLEFAGFLLWATANLLDYVINIGILGFSDWAPAGLYTLWQTIRQIVTMFVVFSGLYLGFMYIINRGQDFQRYIPWIVIFGLFVNFSYPITKAAIDVSNIVSLNIYASALGTTATLAKTNTSGSSAGAQIMKSLGLQGLVMGATAVDGTKTNADLKGQINTTPAALLVVGYVLYAAYIFLIASGLLMVRTLALSFIIIASPILFVDAVIPKLGEQAQKLRKIFFEQLSVSIVFMIMLYLSIAMTKVFSSLGGGGGAGTNITQIFNVLMMLILLHIMIKVTKAVSGSIGQMAGDAMGKFGGFAGGAALGLATGGAGLLARSTVGAAAARWSTSEALASQQGSWLGRRKLDLATSLAGSSFDARNTNVMKVAGNMGGLSRGLGMTGTLKTYDQAKKAKDEDIQRRAGMIKNDATREKYLQGQQTSFGSDMQRAAFVIGGPKGEVLKTDTELSAEKFKKDDAEMLKKYAGASNDVRETMAQDDKNKQFAERFAKIDAFLDKKMSASESNSFYGSQDPEMKDVLKKQELAIAMKDTSKKVQSTKEFLSATPEEKTILGARASESEQELYAKIEEYQKLSSETKEGLEGKIKILKEFGNDSVAKAVITNDTLDTLSDKGNQARSVKIQAAYNEVNQKEMSPNTSDKQLELMTADLQKFISGEVDLGDMVPRDRQPSPEKVSV